jgi:hypothetical protein
MPLSHLLLLLMLISTLLILFVQQSARYQLQQLYIAMAFDLRKQSRPTITLSYILAAVVELRLLEQSDVIIVNQV